MQKGWAHYSDPSANSSTRHFIKTKTLEDPMNKIVGKNQASVSTRSFSSARYSGATVVGTTYRLPNVMVYLSAQEGPMKITRRIRTLKHPEGPKCMVSNPLPPTQPRRNQDLSGIYRIRKGDVYARF